jgi:hypothetical protein
MKRLITSVGKVVIRLPLPFSFFSANSKQTLNKLSGDEFPEKRTRIEVPCQLFTTVGLRWDWLALL